MSNNDSLSTNKTKSGYKLQTIILICIANIMLVLIFSAASSYFGGFASNNGESLTRNSIDQRLNIPIMIHLTTVIPSIPLGGYILWRKKGDHLHKFLGKIWASMMMITAIASFWVGSPGTGVAGTGFSFIHIFAVVTVISIPFAIYRIRRGDVEGHYKAMQGVYFGLLVAGLLSFLPGRIMHILAFG